MKILHVYHIYPALFGGASAVVFEFVNALNNLGHEVDVLTTNAYFSNEKNNILMKNIHRFPVVSKWLSTKNLVIPNPKFVMWTKNMIKEYDCVHIHGYRNFYTPFIYHYLKKYAVPYILQAHGTLPNIMGKQILKSVYDTTFGYKLLHDSAKVIALNFFEAEQYRRMGVPDYKIKIIPNGIALSEYTNMPPKGSFRKKFGLNKKEKIVLYIGRIHKIKGIDFLIKAFFNVVKRSSDVKLVIVGPDADGYLVEIKKLINTLGLNKYVLLTGPLLGKSKLEAYIDASIVVVPSRYEMFPMVVLESYACSTPVIASRVGGLQEIVSHGITGLLVKQGAVDELSSALEIILNNDELRNKLALNAKKYVECNFSINRIVDSLEATYVKILGS